MRKKIILAVLLMGSSAHSALLNSKLAPQHQEILKKEALLQCGLDQGQVVEVSTKVIGENTFETVLEVHRRLDALLTYYFSVTVVSRYVDGNNYSIESVSYCTDN